MKRLNVLAIGGALFVSAALMFAQAATAGPALDWSQSHVEVEAVPGGLVTTEVEVIAIRSVNGAELEVTGAIGRITSAQPHRLGDMQAGERRLVTLTFNAEGLENPQYNGVLQVRSATRGNAVLARPLPLALRVVTGADGGQVTVVVTDEWEGDQISDETTIWVDGAQAAQLAGEDRITLALPSGRHRIAALVPLTSAAVAEIDVAPGSHQTVELLLKSGSLPMVEQYRIQTLHEGDEEQIVPSTSTAVAFQLVRDDGSIVALTRLNHASATAVGFVPEQFQHLPGEPIGRPVDLTPFLSLSEDGTRIEATNVAGFMNAIRQFHGQFEIEISAHNVATGLVYATFTRLIIGRHEVDGGLRAPPSEPGVGIDGLPVRLRVMGTSIELHATSDAAGRFRFPFVPTGAAQILAQTSHGQMHYASAGTLMVDQTRYPRVNLLGTADIANGVPELVLVSSPGALGGAAFDIETHSQERAEADRSHDAPLWFGVPVPQTTGSISVSAAAAAQNQAITGTATLDVPTSATQVTLRFQVSTAEYPYYVRSQSQFNDTWSVEVRASTGVLFNIARNVNAQLHGAPQWQTNGSTGLITEVIDLSQLGAPASGTHQLTLTVRTTNIGDSALPTYVNAQLSGDGAFLITAADRMATPLVSIPRPGSTNTDQVLATLSIVSPQTGVTVSDLSHVESELRLASGQQQQVVDEPGIGGPVTASGTRAVDVVVSFGGANAASQLQSTPPPANGITYAFDVTASVNGADENASAQINGKRALWRMPDGIGRVGMRDRGGDDWAALGTYTWMDANRGLLTLVNDISGEHARDIGHRTHRNGTDIDMFHFGANLGGGAPAGSTNYNAVRRLAIEAINGNAASEATLTAWIQDQRAGLQALVNNGVVARVIGPLGRPVVSGNVQQLPEGWLQSLIRQGTIALNGVEVLNIGGGLQSNRVLHDHVHNDHYHVDLDDSQFRNAP
jgi:hypothetical protein